MPQLGDDRASGKHLAYRYRVHPDGIVTIQIEQHREIAEPLFTVPTYFLWRTA